MPDPAKEIIKAAKNGQAARLRELLAGDPALIDARDKDGSTPLHCATWKGQQEVVALLIKAGADVNAHNNNDHWGTTPLHAAASSGHKDVAELLLANKANVKTMDYRGLTPLHWAAAFMGHKDVVQLLLTNHAAQRMDVLVAIGHAEPDWRAGP